MPSDQMIGGGRPVRRCSACGQVDDHPRDIVDNGDPAVELNYHLDCHANLGCPACAAQIADRPDGATGQELLDHIVAQAPTVTQHDAPQED